MIRHRVGQFVEPVGQGYVGNVGAAQEVTDGPQWPERRPVPGHDAQLGERGAVTRDRGDLERPRQLGEQMGVSSVCPSQTGPGPIVATDHAADVQAYRPADLLPHRPDPELDGPTTLRHWIAEQREDRKSVV